MRVGHGYDIHALKAGRKLVLAGVVVDSERGPVAHSDGDVLCHALADAVLGASAAGDLGEHFPDDSPRWKDAPGLDILSGAHRVAEDLGFRAAQADLTLVLERPRIGPAKAAIREAIARTLGLAPGSVGLKARTSEGLGAVGRGEAVAAWAVVLMEPVAAGEQGS